MAVINYFQDIDIVEGSGSGSATVTEPVTLQEAKDHLYITGTQDDTILTGLITACRQAIEKFCHISIVQKVITVTITRDNTPKLMFASNFVSNVQAWNEFELPEGPHPDILSVTGFNFNQSTSLVLNTDYFIKGTLFKTLKIINAYEELLIVYSAGYTTVPENLKLAIKNEISFRFELRGESTNRYAQQNVGLSESANYLAQPYRRIII